MSYVDKLANRPTIDHWFDIHVMHDRKECVLHYNNSLRLNWTRSRWFVDIRSQSHQDRHMVRLWNRIYVYLFVCLFVCLWIYVVTYECNESLVPANWRYCFDVSKWLRAIHPTRIHWNICIGRLYWVQIPFHSNRLTNVSNVASQAVHHTMLYYTLIMQVQYANNFTF